MRSIRKLPALWIALVALLTPGCSSEAPELVGSLNRELSPPGSHLAVQRANLVPMEPEDQVSQEVPAGMTDQVFQAEISVAPGQKRVFVLIEPRQGRARAFVDLNGNKKTEAREELALGPSADPEFSQEALLEVPLQDASFPNFPVQIRLWKNTIVQGGQAYSARAVAWSTFAALRGQVEIGGQDFEFSYEGLLPGRLVVDPRQGILGLDGDSDGRIDFSPLSPEWTMARNEVQILRAGEHFVSFQQLDPSTGRAVFNEHPPAEYSRIDLRRGKQLPDFSFLDFDGERRSLSQFRGKYLLLDFWGSWCGPCIAEYPNLIENYREFNDRGFEILGMNADPAPQELREGVSQAELDSGLSKARATVERFGAGWPQARTESIMKLLLDRFQIYAYPTSILIDPEGRIVSTNEADLPLRGPGLKQTLKTVMGIED